MRIPYGPNSAEVEDRPPIYFTHSLGSSAQVFSFLTPDKSPAFYFANLGYDVWINNMRGNVYSRRHQNLDPETDPEYWDFDLIDSIEDHRANIQYILDHTGYAQVHNFAFSLGGVTLSIALSVDPEWFGQRLTSFTMIAVPGSLAHTDSFLFASLSYPWVLNTVEAFGIHVVFDRSPLTQLIMPNLCLFIPIF